MHKEFVKVFVANQKKIFQTGPLFFVNTVCGFLRIKTSLLTLTSTFLVVNCLAESFLRCFQPWGWHCHNLSLVPPIYVNCWDIGLQYHPGFFPSWNNELFCIWKLNIYWFIPLVTILITKIQLKTIWGIPISIMIGPLKAANVPNLSQTCP